MSQERLKCCAIIRYGVIHSFGCRSHADIRARLKDEDAYKSKPGDTEGFLTEDDKFVTREEAQDIGLRSGQVTMRASRLLSSEVVWGGKLSTTPKTYESKRWPNKRRLF